MAATHTELRQYLLEELRKELVGPFRPDEELMEGPIYHYLTGILFPVDTPIDPEEDRDANEAPDDDEVVDPGTVMAAATNPSALGMTFVVACGTRLLVDVKAAVYLQVIEGQKTVWQRKQLGIDSLTLTVDGARTERNELSTGLELFVRIRPRNERCVVTVSLTNTLADPGQAERTDPYCFFQPEIQVRAADEGEGVFLPRGEEGLHHDREERLENELLYRHAPEYAVGHGCAVEWDTGEGDEAVAIRTTIIPSYELLQFSPDPEQPFRAQEMRFLAQANVGELIDELQVLPQRYRAWIQELDLDDVSDRLKDTAVENIRQSRIAADRMEAGIALIARDETVRAAFQLANRAMLLQRAHVSWIRMPDEDRPSEPVMDESHRWRPFQLAFILLCLPSIADPDSDYRDVVDLLWFPTGGGKTEAYLGLTAFTIFLRRMRLNGSPRAAGVTVLMRYTLRLLTIQQFQRAATLIMACEHLRRTREDIPGQDPITLGLWVGGDATPNWLSQAATALEALLNKERVLKGNPYQIHSCPWCGTDLTPRHYHVGPSLTIGCPNTECDFAGNLPLYLVDEDIYNRRPTLLIGTVDKFARLPWMAETSNLFGGIDRAQLPPELIVQDELHLISGPLGTLVGLYETAIDLLCQNDGRFPKVIASTATIRRAAEQSQKLFNRGFAQFPPPALDSRDNFFSEQVSSAIRPGRCYVGVHAPGRSIKTALLRIYAVLLQRMHEHSADDALRDPYWTLVGYFNSMRELGGAVRLVEDDVRDRITLLARREGVPQRRLFYTQELNSRVGSDKIPDILEDMSRSLDEGRPLDVLLATNMISVGMDVSRLGLMVVTGQPKMTSEYIQATSRVGREFPGLVVTLYNWTRPRDRSHYERFTSYHSTLYSQVEPTSVTPFSSRARDRGLHGVFISLMRHLSPELNPDEAAHRFEPDSPLVAYVREKILERVASVEPGEVEETERKLDEICHQWDTLAMQQPLPYGSWRREIGEVHLMVAAEEAERGVGLMFPTLNSLREVEGEAGIFFLRPR